ncbi:MAG: hypothetical protein RLZZ292_1502 [Bacteroidota bacterium]|jgi:hypothetical protein
MKSFDTWSYEEVEDTFGISLLRNSPLFEEWTNTTGFVPTERVKETLDEYKELLFDEVENWNEDELKLFFIGPLLSLIHFKTPYFKPYTQRTLTLKSATVEASGKVDYMIARGKKLPKVPYFCLHEYKQENRRDNDPLGQLLIGMVAAQSKNETDMPIFGTYISGRNWFFVLLEGNKYCKSNAFNASSNDIYDIFCILEKCKTLAEKYAKALV